jgi:drug/metabolite transporter (DMT)-like permease
MQPVVLCTLSLLAFAGNSLLARLALAHTAIDPASFTTLRLVAGAAVLWLLVRRRDAARVEAPVPAGDWPSALALFTYAAAFSYAYVAMSAGTGALLLFGAVQATMLGAGLWRGERFTPGQWAGLAIALAGLVALLLPGLDAPPPGAALLMVAAGAAWGVYSLRGARASQPLRATAGNFVRAAPLAILLNLAMHADAAVDLAGAACAIASGAITSGIGYAAWYAVLPRLPAMAAAVLQLAVPVVAAIGGVLLLDEVVGLRLVLCSMAILGGVLLVLAARAGGRRP